MTGHEFELLVKRLFEAYLEKEFGKPIPIEHQKRITKGTYSYTLDLYYHFQIAGLEYENLIECKYWNQKVDRDTLNTVASKLSDLHFHKAIVVTSEGFQKGAIEFAKSQRIALVKVIDGKNFEFVQHFDGGMASIEEDIQPSIEKADLNEPAIKGLAIPGIDIYSFITKKYGKELSQFLKEDNLEKYLDMGAAELPKIIKEQLGKMPINFLSEYERIETSGLPFKLSNENELRMINMNVTLLKVSQMASEQFRSRD